MLDPLSGRGAGMDESLEFLYGPDGQGGTEVSAPRLHRWLGDLRRLFPAGTLHFLQQEALDRLGLTDVLLEPELMKQLNPDVHLAGVLLQTYASLDPKRRASARSLIRQVADELLARLRPPMVQAIRGRALRPHRRTNPPWRDMDWAATIRANLRHYLPEEMTVIPERRIGFRPQRRHQKDLILLVDQSGSMMDSLIYAGLYANVLMQLPAVQLTVLAFDMKVLDITALSHDPVDLLLGFQLGGGTNIANALDAARARIHRPADTVVVLISDLFEGGSEAQLIGQAKAIVDTGARLLVILALDQDGRPSYHPEVARRLAGMGIPAFACTSDQFPEVMSGAMYDEVIPEPGR